MFSIDIKEQDNLAIATSDGEIAESDIDMLRSQIDAYINAHDKAPNVVLCINHFPQWKTFDALVTHIKFVKNHQQLIQKVALVSNSHLLSGVRAFADHFTGAKIRHFSESNLDKAVDWAEAEDDHPGEFVVLSGCPNDVVALEAKGIITAQDYRKTLMPLIDTKLKEHDKLKLLFVAGEDFSEYSAGALWDDTRFGFSHMLTFSKLALVSDVEWIRRGAKFFGPLMPTELMVFNLVDLEEAKKWIQY